MSDKSTLLALLAAQFRKYADAQVFAFDKGASMYCLTKAFGGDHYDITAEDHTPTVFSPLDSLHNKDDRIWMENNYRLSILNELKPLDKKTCISSYPSTASG